MNERWDVRKCTPDDLRCLIDEWCISQATLLPLLNHICTVVRKFELNQIRNIGFPLRRVDSEKVVGYELINYGYRDRLLDEKNKDGYWIVQPDLPPSCIEKLILFRDGINLMSFCEMKNVNFETSALVSVGSKPNNLDFEQLLEYFPRAKVVTCFENSIPGNILDIEIALARRKSRGRFSIEGNMVEAEVDGKLHRVPTGDFRLSSVRKLFSLRYTSVVTMKPADALNFSEQLIKRNTISTKNAHL